MDEGHSGADGLAAAATAALGSCEDLLGQIRPGTRDPGWLDYFNLSRLAADATGDLPRPGQACGLP
ncbi:hypothetical protein [Kitasatospora sp. McL0602]|uniref:hypothetical protein n=1 Tax=Kitasatospora sp. McL0602 TaxID=3439530 RepID=UPI003F8A6C62